MIRKFCLALIATSSMMFAQQIDNIEFSLPANKNRDWQMIERIENAYGTALIFSLEEDEDLYYGYYDFDDESDQLFYATHHEVSFNPYLSAEDLEDQLALVFPFIKYQFHLVEQNDDSSLFEFYGFDEDGPLWYGLLRNMRSAHGTVTLTFMTDIDENTPQARKLGMAALRCATAH